MKKLILLFPSILLTFSLSAQSWNQLGLDIDGEAAGDNNGHSVSISDDGNTIAVGAPFNNNHTGHVKIYTFNGSSWTQLGQDIDGESIGDESGWSVSLSSDGTTVAIGAWYNDGIGNNSGDVRIYNFDGLQWFQLGQYIDGEAPDDYSGVSVTLSGDGNTVVVGARHNDGNGDQSGHVRIYSYNGNSWNQ